jgi:hypothetical protein
MTIKAGTYKARATGDVVVGVSKERRTPFVEVAFAILTGEHEGSTVRWTSYFTDNTAERTLEALYYCGWTGDDLAEFADHKLHGLDKNEVEIVVELESYEKDGETKQAPRVRWVNRPGGGRVNLENAMDRGTLTAFGQRMRGLALKVKNGKAASTAAPPAAAPSADDSIPF